jgi:predicted Rossmann fold flavoprotein
VPSLFTFEIKDTRLDGRSGVSFNKVSLKLPGILKKEIDVTLLITHWGLSGPAVIKLSAFAAKELFENNYHCPLLVNFLPDLNLEKIKTQLLNTKSTQSKKEVLNYVCFELPKSYWQAACNYVGIVEKQPWAETSDKQLRLLSETLTQAKFNIQGKGKFKEEFVTCGGVSLKEVDFKTMQSKICPNLYFTGEILDIDGITGGFNFQSAWTTAWIAAKSINLNKS